MSDIMEITELDFESGGRSSNFGGGLELLMNENVRENSRPKSDIDSFDLNKLENELNDLVDEVVPNSSFPSKSDLFDRHNVSFSDEPAFKLNSDHGSDNGLGRATKETENDHKTWDGYGKFNNIPLNPDNPVPLEPKLSREDTMREKFKFLRRLEALEKKGVELSKKYSMESNLHEMMGEYETIMDEKSTKNSVKFQGNMLMAVINGFEFLNSKFDPFDIKLDGWSDQLQENITDYDEIFAELHEKYKSKASMAPELKLLFQLGGSAMMVHMTNTMFKSAMPGMDDILRQNPDLMRSFQTATVNSMAQSSPGLSGFMSNMMNNPEPSRGMGPPPSLATQGPHSIPPPTNRPGNNNYARPDLNYSKSNFQDGISIRENMERNDLHERGSRKQVDTRPEMKGPSDITDILSGLKTKTINIQQPTTPNSPTTSINQNDSSTISFNDLKDIQSGGNMPKRSGRRKKSASNTVSLDI